MKNCPGCNQMTFPATRSAARIKLWIYVTDMIWCSCVQPSLSGGGTTRKGGGKRAYHCYSYIISLKVLMCSFTIETSSIPTWKSLVIFANLRKMFGKCSSSLRNNYFGNSWEIFGEWSEIFGKSSKASLLVWKAENGTSHFCEPHMISFFGLGYWQRYLGHSSVM